MWHLIRAELTRLRWRRAVLVLVAAAFVVPALIAVNQVWATRPVSAHDLVEAQRELDAMAAEQMEDCLDHPRHWGIRKDLAPEKLEERCRKRAGSWGTAEEWIGRQTLDLEQVRTEPALAMVTVLVLAGALAATTFAGHDWATGSMSNQLLFESRRGRVYAAKGAAVALLLLVVSVVTLAFFWAVVATTATSRGIDTPGATWEAIGWGTLRSVGVVVGAGLLTYAVTMLFRSTVASLGLMFATTMLSSIALALVGLGERWMLPSNMFAFVTGRYEYWDENAAGCNSEHEYCFSVITWTDSSVYLGVLLLLAVVLGLVSFRRRDVP